ncbi:DsbA family oxidoreductase [Caryophanon tenue]|uniref:Peptidoglycan hydrolase n=1 Tax=Caryophanon tenue TaxID=33978 RepID=A0A1C0YC48_9BACL|nr:DsbA family oxidoreductase [Caryophanon tenue]OCS84715.1 peptidoglycan hydrolase [Caryophanon tenue]
MNIEVFSDFACPFCYIGKKRLEQAIVQLGLEQDVTISYKAYQLRPDASKTDTTRLTEAVMSEEMMASITAHANEVGLTYRLDLVQIGNTENAHRLAKWAQTKGAEHAFIEETLHRYFTQGLNVNDDETLVQIIEALGLPVDEARAVLQDEHVFQEALAQDRYDTQQIPVTSVPFFVFENRYGIKGVEPLEVFVQTLRQTKAYVDKQQALRIAGSDGTSCSIDGCE